MVYSRYFDFIVHPMLGGVVLLDSMDILSKEWSRYRSVEMKEYKCYVLGRGYMIPDLLMLLWRVSGLDVMEHDRGDSFMVCVLEIDYKRMMVRCERV